MYDRFVEGVVGCTELVRSLEMKAKGKWKLYVGGDSVGIRRALDWPSLRQSSGVAGKQSSIRVSSEGVVQSRPEAKSECGRKGGRVDRKKGGGRGRRFQEIERIISGELGGRGGDERRGEEREVWNGERREKNDQAEPSQASGHQPQTKMRQGAERGAQEKRKVSEKKRTRLGPVVSVPGDPN